ncbi:methylenetetrahydrofolate reductase C-terminal domain-containing protein [uncultured Friedmanniella sp.]|uniref:methylenetetrahydrofolate reductase C-terminal domain-containing protein n=1 Tax=uncultured Friedmanniella sp. TaxID=335381 RepID=UPI0035CB4D88
MTDPAALAATDCPKQMVHGPCGGVHADGSCELGDRRCSFVDGPVVPRQPLTPAPVVGEAPSSDGAELRTLLAAGRVVVADFPAAALSTESVAATAAVLRGRVHAVLAGDSPRSRVQFPPAFRAGLIQAAGLRVWAGLNCRDRNRVALEGEVAALAAVGVAAVHCVTGDHTATGSRPDAAPVFDLDSTQLAELCAAAGLLTSVGESPATPPTEHRPARLVEKLTTGAEVCFVNHCGGAAEVGRFVGAVRTLGVDPRFVPCVPIVLDHASAALLASFPSLVLPAGYLDRVLAAADPWAVGIAAAVELAESYLAIDGVAGVNLSGGGAPGEEVSFAGALAEISTRLAGETVAPMSVKGFQAVRSQTR